MDSLAVILALAVDPTAPVFSLNLYEGGGEDMQQMKSEPGV